MASGPFTNTVNSHLLPHQFGCFVMKCKESAIARILGDTWHKKFLIVDMQLAEVYYANSNSASDVLYQKKAIGFKVHRVEAGIFEARLRREEEASGFLPSRQEIRVRVHERRRYEALLSPVLCDTGRPVADVPRCAASEPPGAGIFT